MITLTGGGKEGIKTFLVRTMRITVKKNFKKSSFEVRL